MPEVKAMLRISTLNTYGWQCDHVSQESTNIALDAWSDWSYFPNSWPKDHKDPAPLGIIKINDDIYNTADRRWKAIQNGLGHAGPHYPYEEVRSVLAYWKLDPSKGLKNARI